MNPESLIYLGALLIALPLVVLVSTLPTWLGMVAGSGLVLICAGLVWKTLRTEYQAHEQRGS